MRKSLVLRMGVFISIILIIAFLFGGCSSNYSPGVGNLNFNHVHFSDTIESHCATIEKWYDNATGIEVKTMEHGAVFLSEGTYIMFSDATKCPYCQ